MQLHQCARPSGVFPVGCFHAFIQYTTRRITLCTHTHRQNYMRERSGCAARHPSVFAQWIIRHACHCTCISAGNPRAYPLLSTCVCLCVCLRETQTAPNPYSAIHYTILMYIYMTGSLYIHCGHWVARNTRWYHFAFLYLILLLYSKKYK